MNSKKSCNAWCGGFQLITSIWFSVLFVSTFVSRCWRAAAEMSSKLCMKLANFANFVCLNGRFFFHFAELTTTRATRQLILTVPFVSFLFFSCHLFVTLSNEFFDTSNRSFSYTKRLVESEIVNLHIGQAGCQLGNSCWELYCFEHNIRLDGITCQYDELPEAFFSKTGAGKVVPRAAFIDLEPSVIDEIRTGSFRNLFNSQMLISGKEDAANCFARGYFSVGKELSELALYQIHKMVEECDQFQGFLIFRSYGGGTGSGMAALLIETLSMEYPKCNKMEFSIYPAPKLSSVIVEPYNVALATHHSLEYSNTCFIVDNEASYDICDRLLDICSPNFGNVNRLMGHVIAAATSSLRFANSVNVNLNEIQTNLIPFPRIQYPIISYAPLMSKKQIAYETITPSALINACFEPAHQMVKCDVRKSKYMACVVLLQGDITSSMINSTVSTIKTKRSGNFVDWCPTSFKIGVNNMPPVCVPGGDLTTASQSCVMLANSTAIRAAWAKINRKFDLMFAKKAFIHWYISEGLEESDFHDTRLDMGALEMDYKEVESER